jgi:hypothetical protein
MLVLGVVALVIFGVMILLPGLALLEPVGTDVTNKTIKRSAELPVFMWCLGCPIAFARRCRWLLGLSTSWAFGCLFLFWHIAIAFHLGHGWSHQAAWEHTRQVGGYGDGIFVNYAFALVWLADAIWVWVAPGSYLTRPPWLHWSIHAFLAFVVFNAAVVFADWRFRSIFLSWFVAWSLLLALGVRYMRRRYPPKENGAASDADRRV